MKPVIDIHSHILPGLDDGCQNREEALVMLKMYEAQGAEAVVCTPHFGPCGNSGADTEGAFRWLKSVPSPVRLCLGNEVLAGCFGPEQVNAPDGPRTLAGTDVLLVEFDEYGSVHTDAETILRTVTALNRSRWNIILAHPERYESLKQQPEICREIVRNGIPLQVNAYDVFENKNESTRSMTQWLLENRLVSYLGSDAHGAHKRPPALSTGVRWIYDHCPEDYADAVVHNNAAKLIAGGTTGK